MMFLPPAFLENPHLQTLVPYYFSSDDEMEASQLERIELSDGDQLSLAINTPSGWTSKDRTVLMLHGLTGNHMSPYMSRLAGKIYQEGINVVRINFRGCGPGLGLARRPYHAGQTADVWEVLKYLVNSGAGSITLMGFSMGGNLALKLAGELGSCVLGGLDSVISVCPPVDLHACLRRLEEPQSRFYEWLFIYYLKRNLAELWNVFEDMKPLEFPNKMGLRDFDDLYTAPLSGYKNSEDYYNAAQAVGIMDKIKLPTFILASLDDPVVDSRPLEQFRNHPHIHLKMTKRGGHLGFWGRARGGHGQRWMDEILLEWLLTR